MATSDSSRRATSPAARAAAGLLAVALACGGLTGCVSTQEKNARAKLRATRELESRAPQRVAQANPDVQVVRATAVRGRRSDAVVVVLRSRAPRALTDVPIAVGVRRPGGRRVVLNGRGGLDWFQTHIPAIPARGTVTWVFAASRSRVPAGWPFARVGVARAGLAQSASERRVDALPRIEAAVASAPRPAAVQVQLANRSGIPQYGLQVYAVARQRGRDVAAGRATLAHLGTGGRAQVRVPLIGAVGGAPVRVHAIPTIFE